MELTKELDKSSIELTKNAKGSYQYSIKVYFDDQKEGLNKIKDLHRKIKEYIVEENGTV